MQLATGNHYHPRMPTLLFWMLVIGAFLFYKLTTRSERRWLIETDAHGVETVQPIGQDDFVANWSRLVKDIASGECLRSSAELVNMANACTARLQQRGGPARLAA